MLFFTSPQGAMFGFNFYLYLPIFTSFLFCLVLHFHFVFLVHESSPFVQSNLYPCNGFVFLHILSTPATTASHFLHSFTSWSTASKGSAFLLFCDKFQSACMKYSPKCIQQFLRDRRAWRVPRDFHKPLSNAVSPNFTIELVPSVVSPIFSPLEPYKPCLKDTHDFNMSWNTSSHIIFPLQTDFPFWR